jgi:hypothetical protein
MKLRCVALLLSLLPSAALAGTVDIVFLDSFEAGCGDLIYAEPFTLSDGSSWPAPWTALGNIAAADIQQGMARLQPQPTGYSLARMGAAVANSNVDVRFTLRIEDTATQGVGFYVRQNGGYLTQTATHGQGYAVFVEGDFRAQPGIGLWKELDGSESPIMHAPYQTLVAGVDYRVRFQILQSSPSQTLSRAKLWLASDAEPAAWQASVTDTTAPLQNVSGGIAVDSWSSRTSAPISAYTFIDNIELVSLCAP